MIPVAAPVNSGVGSTTMLPKELLDRLRERAYKGTVLKMANLLDVRGLIEDAKAEGNRVLMQMYGEIAEAMLVHPDTVRADLATIRNYSPEKLMYWTGSGLGFSHIETANTFGEMAHKSPMQLLDEAVALGGPNGKPMTVQELIAFSLGEQKREPAMFRVNALLSRLARFPDLLKWDTKKAGEFTQWMDAGRRFFE
jgi:hypothetical protein